MILYIVKLFYDSKEYDNMNELSNILTNLVK